MKPHPAAETNIMGNPQGLTEHLRDRITPGEPIELSVVIPCLNEARSLGICIDKAMAAFKIAQVTGEVVVSDNGSTDGSIEIATRHGARVVHATVRGYGNALRKGIEEARGEFIVMGDADDSYDFSELPEPFRRRHQARSHALVSQTGGESCAHNHPESLFCRRDW